MRGTILLSVTLLAVPAALAAQSNTVQLEQRAVQNWNDIRLIALLPNEVVGFRVLGSADARTMRVTTGHMVAGHLYHAVATILPRDGSRALRAEGTISSDVPRLSLGALPDGGYVISMHLEDLLTGSTRDAKSSVILR